LSIDPSKIAFSKALSKLAVMSDNYSSIHFSILTCCRLEFLFTSYHKTVQPQESEKLESVSLLRKATRTTTGLQMRL
jgi:hypothetical protein